MLSIAWSPSLWEGWAGTTGYLTPDQPDPTLFSKSVHVRRSEHGRT